MKKMNLLFLCMLIIIMNINIAYAAPINELLKKQQANEADKKIINNILEKRNLLQDLFADKEQYLDKDGAVDVNNIKSVDELSYGEPFKVMYFADKIPEKNASVFKGVYKKFLSGMKLADIIEDEAYFWKLPVLYNDGHSLIPVSSLEIGNADNGKLYGGEWHIKGWPGYLDFDITYLCSQPDKMAEWLKEKGITEADKVMYVNMPWEYYFIYILSNNKEYFIPLTEDSLTKKFKVYTRSEFQAIYGPVMEKVVNNWPIEYTGGMPNVKSEKSSRTKTVLNTKAVIILGPIAILGVLYYTYNKKRFRNNKIVK